MTARTHVEEIYNDSLRPPFVSLVPVPILWNDREQYVTKDGHILERNVLRTFDFVKEMQKYKSDDFKFTHLVEIGFDMKDDMQFDFSNELEGEEQIENKIINN